MPWGGRGVSWLHCETTVPHLSMSGLSKSFILTQSLTMLRFRSRILRMLNEWPSELGYVIPNTVPGTGSGPLLPAFQIRDILERIRILGSIPLSLWLTDPAPDPEPALFVNDLQNSVIKKFLFNIFKLPYTSSRSQIKIHKEVRKQYTRNHGGSLVFLLDDGRIQIRIRTSDYRIRIREAHSLRIRI